MDEELRAMLDGIQEEQRGMKAALAKGAAPERKTMGGEYRNAGEYLRALVDGDEAAVNLYREGRDLIVTGNTGNTSTWIADDLRLIEQRRKVMGILTHDSLPSTGMSMEYNVVETDTTSVTAQAKEGDTLAFGKVSFGTKVTGESEKESTLYGPAAHSLCGFFTQPWVKVFGSAAFGFTRAPKTSCHG